MATFGRPDGYDDSSEDEFDGFVFGDSYNSREEFGHKDRDFVPSASGMVKRDKEACSDHTSPEPSANTSGGVKFSLDPASNGLHHYDITVTNSDSQIKSAHQIDNGHLRKSPRKPRGRYQRESRRRHDHQSLQDTDGRSKGQLKGAEESENFRIAVQRGNVIQVKRILENGFDPNTVLSSGWSALMHSCDSANLEITELLLEHGANPRTRKDQYTALMALCARPAESKGQIKTARLLINRGAVVNSHDRHKMSPLLYVCRGGHLGLAELLISVNADINKQDSRGWTPLHYAASQGNTQLVQLLVESNANLEIACNLGDTPASVAYSNNHAELRDWLESITSPSRGGVSGADSTTLPVFVENKQTEYPKALSSDVIMTSSLTTKSGREDDIRFGDLELFLKGEQLWSLMPLFREHRVEFSDLLNMTDKDLEQMGISEIGTRRKILTSVAAVHKKEWQMPTNTLPRNRVLSAMEAAFILSNLARHSSYIKATATHLLSHVRSDQDMIGPYLLPNERERLTSDLSGAVATVHSLQDEVLILQREVNSALSQAPPTPTNLPVRRSRGLLLLKVIGGVGLFSCVVYITGRTVVKYLSS